MVLRLNEAKLTNVRISDVVSETVFTFERSYKVSKRRTSEMVSDVISLPGVQLPAKSRCVAALELHATTNISFIDVYNALDMQTRGLTEISRRTRISTASPA